MARDTFSVPILHIYSSVGYCVVYFCLGFVRAFYQINEIDSTLSFINGVRGAGTDLYKIFIMKKFLFFLAVTACLVTTGCSDEYDDSVLTERIEALENRMKELEELCKRLNENDYITSVEPVIENGKTVGYELSFGKSDPITIYHGKDGADSAITEVTQDEQNVYLTLQDGTVITLPKKESSGGSGDGDNSGEGSDSGDDGDNGDGGEEADPTKASVEVPKAGGLDLALEDADLLRIETLRVSGFLNDDDIRFIYRNLPRVACLDLSQAKMEVWESAISMKNEFEAYFTTAGGRGYVDGLLRLFRVGRGGYS